MAAVAGKRLNHLSRVNYANRSLSFLAGFVVILLLGLERNMPWQWLIFPAVFLLVYPHLLVLVFRRRGAGQRAEIRAMLLEALPLGMMVAWIEFFLWMSFTLLTATLLNNALVGGMRQFLQAVGLFAVGVAAGGMLTGWQISPDGHFYTELVSMALLLAYTVMVAFVAYGQNLRLIEGAREIEERNRIFQALVEISTSADLTSDLDEFMGEALRRVHRHYPRSGMGLVVRQAHRSAGLRFASFVAIDDGEQEKLLRTLAETPAPEESFHTRIQLNGTTFHFLFMKGEIRGHEGLIILRTEKINRVLYESMDLFLELLAGTIENKLLATELKNAAERDPLTGVFNRGYLDAELAHAIRNRHQHPSMEFSVMLLDVIGLKEINDTHGHIAGDYYILRTAETLRDICRTTDVLVRYGGDEFVILSHGNTLEGVHGLADRIRKEATGKRLLLGEDPDQAPVEPLHISIGLASSAETPPEKVLQAADEAMYKNKQAWYRNNGEDAARRGE